MNRGEISFYLILLDNTSHMDRNVAGVPLISFFRLNKPPVNNILISYADQNGNPKCEEFNQQTMQNIVTTPLGDYKSICRTGLIELTKKRFYLYEESAKKQDFKLSNDGTGILPIAQDSCTIIFCSDFYLFSEKYFKLFRNGAIGKEYFIRPIDNVICLSVEENKEHYLHLKENFPSWVQTIFMSSATPYQLDFNQTSIPKVRIFQKERFFNMRIIFPDMNEAIACFQMSSDTGVWPLPYDICVDNIKNREWPIPTYNLREVDRVNFPAKPDPNHYILSLRNTVPQQRQDYFAVYDPQYEHPFAVVELVNGELHLYVLPYNFPFFYKPKTTTEVVEYMKQCPACYFATMKRYFMSKGYPINSVESSNNSHYFNERKDFFSSIKRKEHTSTELNFDSSLSLDVIKLAMRDNQKTPLHSVEHYECIENFDTADEINWNTFNSIVFQNSALNNMWKSDSPVSIDRIRDLMPRATEVQSTNVFADESSEVPEETRTRTETKTSEVYASGSIFFQLDQLVMNVRERDFDTLRSRLSTMQKENAAEFKFAKSFVVKTIDRFGLRGIVDQTLIDFLN